MYKIGSGQKDFPLSSNFVESNAACNINWTIFLADGTTKADTDYPNVVHADNTQDGGVKIRIDYSTYTFRDSHEQTDPTF